MTGHYVFRNLRFPRSYATYRQVDMSKGEAPVVSWIVDDDLPLLNWDIKPQKGSYAYVAFVSYFNPLSFSHLGYMTSAVFDVGHLKIICQESL
jgi:hypothetical protein